MTKKLTCDLLVVGAGGSGLISAVKATELSGAKTIVIEAAKKAGGSTFFAHGFASFNSRRHQEAGMPDTRDDVFRRTMDTLWWRTDPKLIRRFVDSSGPMLDWLMDKGAPFERNFMGFGLPERHIYKNNPDPSIGPGWMGSYVVQQMLEDCKKLGIDVLTQTRAKKLIKDDTGKVSSLVADTPEGELEISFKACVLAAGGFGANREKLEKRWPEYFDENPIHIFSVPTNQGDSLDMCQDIGAKVDYKNINIMVGGPAHHPYSYSIYRIMRQPEIVYLNALGKRWIDESQSLEGSYFRLGKEPGAIAWAIADESMKEMLGQRLIDDPPEPSDLPVLKEFRADIERELKHPYATKKADTIEELAVMIGVEPSVLKDEIDRYNSFCEKGHDDDFCKKPETLVPLKQGPYYAFWGQRFSETTHGGIVTDHMDRVLDENGQIMEGLYACGDNSSGWADDQPMPAVSPLTWCVTSGYMTGESVGEYLKGM